MYITTIVIAILATALMLWSISIFIARRHHPVPMHPMLSMFVDNPIRRYIYSPSKSLGRIGVTAGMSVLELGPGPGFLTIEAAHRVGSSGRLCSLDIAPAMIAKTKRKLSDEATGNVSPMVGSGEALPFKEASFDLAYLVTVLGEIPDKNRALQELYRVLRPGGILSVSEFMPDPDYPLRRTVTIRALTAGFEPHQQFGNIFNYVLNFRRAPC